MKIISVVIFLALSILFNPPINAKEKTSFSATSPTCGPVSGATKEDVENVLQWCQEGIPAKAAIGAYAMESILWVKINYEMAQAMKLRRLQTEHLVKIWMKGWKKTSGSKVVTVYVEWKDIEIAKGQTSWSGEDKVTLKGT